MLLTSVKAPGPLVMWSIGKDKETAYDFLLTIGPTPTYFKVNLKTRR